MLFLSVLLIIGYLLFVLPTEARAGPHKRADPSSPAQVLQPFRTSSSGSKARYKPPAPSSYTAYLTSDSGRTDTLRIDSAGNYIPFELYTLDLLYAYEGATNQLVAARGIPTHPVKNGVYQQTGTFRVNLDPHRATDDDFTLEQLRMIIDALYDFSERFNVRDMVFSYKVGGKLRHLLGYLHLDGGDVPTHFGSNLTGAVLPTAAATHVSTRTLGAVSDPFSTPAWDALRFHTPATVTFSNYGAPIPFADMAVAVFGIYHWIWSLIVHSRTENFSFRLQRPLLEDVHVKVDVKGQESGWLPLWAVRSMITNVFHFWLDGEKREISMKYEDKDGRTMWGYMTRGGTRPLPPRQRAGGTSEEGVVVNSR